MLDKVIGFEEHYKLPAIQEANRDNPGELVYDVWKKAGRFQTDAQGGWPAGIYDLGEGRIAAMDAAGIDVQILSHTAPGPETLEPSLAVDLAKQANDAVAAAVSKYPERFLGFATLPMRNPEAAASELERVVRDQGFVGTLINGHVNGRYLDDKFFWPVFECAETLDVPIYLHPVLPPKPVVDAYYTGFDPYVSTNLSAAGLGWQPRHRDPLHTPDPGRGVRPVPLAADHRGTPIRSSELDGVADGLLVSAGREWRPQTDHQGIPS